MPQPSGTADPVIGDKFAEMRGHNPLPLSCILIGRHHSASPPRSAGPFSALIEVMCSIFIRFSGKWVDRAENINGNYAISDKPLTEQEWVEKHVKH